MKKIMIWVLLVMGFSIPAYAQHKECSHGDKQCAMSKASCDKSSDCDSKSGCPITGKVLKKAAFFIDNAGEIGLSEDQIKQIKAIQHDAKKDGLRGAAEMQIFEMDMMAKLSEDKVDVEGLNAMIDGASKGMSDGAKKSIATYVTLKAILTPEQMSKAKAIWKKKS